MAGHNKWTQIKRQKGKTDAQKSKIFGKFAKLITDNAKKAKGNLNDPALKTAIEKAKSFNMPNENIERAIKKATETGGESMENILYEAYGPGGCAILIQSLTSNRNKASQEIKHILSLNGFALANPGSASWAFVKSHDGFEAETMTPINEEDKKVLEKLIDDLENNDEVQEVFTNAE